MEEIEVKTALRKKKRELANALGKDILRYLAELLTNADDSYKRLEAQGIDDGREKIIKIEVSKYKKNNDGYVISVTDNAEGLSSDKLIKIFGEYGGDNANGITTRARGIFGQGASDVLQAAAVEKKTAMIETIKDGKFSKLLYNMDEDYVAKIKVDSPNDFSANKLNQIRESLSIPENGTKITFGVPSQVRFDDRSIKSLANSIAKYPSFRYLLNQSNRKFIFKNGNYEQTISSKDYFFDDDKNICDEDFKFKFDGEFVNCNLKMYINDNKQDDGTHLIVKDENDVVFDNTLFSFEKMSSAKNVSGVLNIEGLYDICYRHLNSVMPDAIVNDNRTGLDTKNPFYDILSSSITPIIEDVLKKNAADTKMANLNNNKKFSDALKKLNKYLKNEMKDEISGGTLDGKVPPAEGIKFARSNISITLGKTYDLKLLINSSIIMPSDEIKVDSDNDENVEFSPNVINYTENEIVDGLVVKNVTIKGNHITETEPVTLKASVGTREAFVTIDVVDADIHYPENGLEFYPNDISLVADKSHFIKLYIDSEIISLNSKIDLSSEGLKVDKNVEFTSKNLLNETIGCINIVVSGGVVDEIYEVKAIFNDIETTAKINITEPTKNSTTGGGLIAGFKIDPEDDGYYQAYYNKNTHYIMISGKNIINQRIMGNIKNPDNPTPTGNQSKYLCDIISNMAATVLVKEKNVKHGEINFDNFEEGVDEVQNLLQEHKSKIYKEIYPAIMGMSEKEED